MSNAAPRANLSFIRLSFLILGGILLSAKVFGVAALATVSWFTISLSFILAIFWPLVVLVIVAVFGLVLMLVGGILAGIGYGAVFLWHYVKGIVTSKKAID